MAFIVKKTAAVGPSTSCSTMSTGFSSGTYTTTNSSYEAQERLMRGRHRTMAEHINSYMRKRSKLVLLLLLIGLGIVVVWAADILIINIKL